MNNIYILDISEKFDFDAVRKNFPKRYENSNKFRNENDRLLSLGAGFLLFSVLKCDENSIHINENGKPYIKASPYYFNLSHSGRYVVLAIGTTEIGIDIEKITSAKMAVAKKVYTADEFSMLEEKTDENFFRLWTMKESVSKLLGKGLSLDFQSFSVCPLFEDKSITVDNRIIFGNSMLYSDYALAVTAEDKNTEIDNIIKLN